MEVLLTRIDKDSSERIPPELEVHPAMPPAAESDLPSTIATAAEETSELAETATTTKQARIDEVLSLFLACLQSMSHIDIDVIGHGVAPPIVKSHMHMQLTVSNTNNPLTNLII
jgi:hypothetical protein